MKILFECNRDESVEDNSRARSVDLDLPHVGIPPVLMASQHGYLDQVCAQKDGTIGSGNQEGGQQAFAIISTLNSSVRVRNWLAARFGTEIGEPFVNETDNGSRCGPTTKAVSSRACCLADSNNTGKCEQWSPKWSRLNMGRGNA